MSYLHRIIILSSLLFTASTHAAYDLFVDGLYWQGSEDIDWAFNSNLSATQQSIAYQTISFSANPGVRIGVGYQGDWDSQFYYTYFYSKSTAAITGNLTSAFMGGKLISASNNNFFYQTGQVSFSINYNILDWDFSKKFYVSPALTLRPIMGIRGGWIYQSVNTYFQGIISIAEYVNNDFKGIGPKAGIESIWQVYNQNLYKLSIFSTFTTSYLWGTWNINDVTTDTINTRFYTNVGGRNFGAFTVQGILGLNLDYKCCSIKLGYEINDWFNQYQVIDDATGAHNNDLILQGLTLKFAYTF